MRTMILGVVMTLGAAGCMGETSGTDAPARASWMLVADARLALRDPRCSGEGCPAYPNPAECASLQVTLHDDGRLCGRCGEEDARCGGPADGIPYRCAVDRAAGCMVCDDIFGTTVVRRCGGDLAVEYGLGGHGTPETPGGAEGDLAGETCFEARRPDGEACSICFAGDRRITEDSCTTQPESERERETMPAEIPMDEGDSTPPVSCPSLTEAANQGRQAFARELNGILAEAGLPADFVAGPATAGESVRTDELMRGESLCGSLGADHVDEAGLWFREGRPRCGHITTSAMYRACLAPTGTCSAFENGVIAEMARASMHLEAQHDCVGSPIVLDLDGDGIESVRSGARFDLGRAGVEQSTTWIRPGDALLAMDRDGDGAIRHGGELFGELTSGASGHPSGDGYAALAALDADGDGDVDAADPSWSRLRIWQDDGDGRSQPAELSSPEAAGVIRIETRSTRSSAIDGAGSILGLWSRFQRTGGGTGLTCDVWFAADR